MNTNIRRSRVEYTNLGQGEAEGVGAGLYGSGLVMTDGGDDDINLTHPYHRGNWALANVCMCVAV